MKQHPECEDNTIYFISHWIVLVFHCNFSVAIQSRVRPIVKNATYCSGESTWCYMPCLWNCWWWSCCKQCHNSFHSASLWCLFVDVQGRWREVSLLPLVPADSSTDWRTAPHPAAQHQHNSVVLTNVRHSSMFITTFYPLCPFLGYGCFLEWRLSTYPFAQLLCR